MEKIESIESAIDLLKKIREEDSVRIKFRKKNNEERYMVCTLNYDNIPKENRPKSYNIKSILKLLREKKSMRVYDLEQHGWRSLSFERAEWLETPKHEKFLINTAQWRKL